jgi:hypothetical protein
LKKVGRSPFSPKITSDATKKSKFQIIPPFSTGIIQLLSLFLNNTLLLIGILIINNSLFLFHTPSFTTFVPEKEQN